MHRETSNIAECFGDWTPSCQKCQGRPRSATSCHRDEGVAEQPHQEAIGGSTRIVIEQGPSAGVPSTSPPLGKLSRAGRGGAPQPPRRLNSKRKRTRVKRRWPRSRRSSRNSRASRSERVDLQNSHVPEIDAA